MLELELTAQDLAYTRFTTSPLWEVMASIQVLKTPGRHAVHQRWVDQVRPRLAHLDWGLLSDLVPAPRLGVPGFLAPPQPTSTPDLAQELAALRAVPPAEVRAALDWLPGPRSSRLTRVYDHPAEGLPRLAQVIQDYWDVAVGPYWPRILSLLESDIRHRAQILAQEGAHRLFNDLDPAITWAGHRLQLDHRSVTGTVRLDGRGLLLAPSVFVWPRIASIVVPPWQPTLRYPPRGVGTLWERRRGDAPAALAAVLGRSRARLLTALETPASTTELARASELSPGGVSQHLTALREAGLVSAHRSGRFVLYARTRAAEAVLAAAAPASSRSGCARRPTPPARPGG